jgi:hypothetical protein
MTMQQHDHQRTEKALEVLETLKRASTPPYFYTRLRARLDQIPVPLPGPWYLRPAYAFSLLGMVLLFNVILVLREPRAVPIQNDHQAMESFTSVTAEGEDLQDVVSFYEQYNDH